MHPILKNREKQREILIAVAKEYAKILSEKIGPLCAVLTGSVARGDFNLHSDIDVIIISDRLPRSPLERSQLLYQYLLPGLEPKGFLTTEFMEYKSRHNPLILDALAYGIPLEDNGFWATVQKT